ncbi:MAG TPA: hypothetical protein VFX86_01535 [Candidatus Saccharimonadales bacterium]|nr:hypothetical protein [Candidatus Saccharimonadales bacterium]
MAADDLYILDFDRTLLDVYAVMELTERACDIVGIEFAGIGKDQVDASAEARSYSPLETIKMAGGDKLMQFKQGFINLADPDKLVFPDGRRYLETLKKKDKPHMILTYAVDIEWQKIKLEASGLIDVPHVITLDPKKGQIIANWLNQGGKYDPGLPGINPAGRIVLIDDRLRAFEYFPDDCKGFYLARERNDRADLPDNVKMISSLDQIIDKI